MPTEKMTMVTLSGPLESIDMALQTLVMDREFHMENTVDAISPVLSISRFSSANPYSPSLDTAVSLMQKLDVQPEYRIWPSQMEAEEVSQWLNELSEKLSAAEKARDDSLKTALDDENILSQLSYFEGVDEELNDLLHMKYVKFRVGRIPEDKYELCLQEMKENKEVYYVSTGSYDEWVYGLYFVLPRVADKVDGQFTAMGFERVRVARELDKDTTPQEAKQLYAKGAEEARLEAARQDEIISRLKTDNAEKLLAYYSWLRYMSDTFDLRYYAGYRYDRFYIVGWVPGETAREYVAEVEANEGFACVIGGSDKRAQIKPPVKMKESRLAKIFSPFVEMYGMPSYGEIDPRSFMAITYTIIFGIMFGDVGQGVCLALVGFIMWKLKKMWLGRVLVLAGCSSTVFGFVYGSIFGFEEIIPGFHVLEGGNTMKILLIAVALGVVLMLICMVMNIINGIRQRDIKKIFFSPNGIAGAVMYLSLAAGVALTALAGINVMTPLYIIVLIILPLLMIFAAEPLTKLVKKEKDWKPESIGMFVVEGFFELFETMLAYVSNTVSFLRVGAFAISHAGMMMVVFMLAQTANGGHNPVAIVLGNVIVMGIEGVLVCIQVMRLEFYEMFGRFYEGSGVKYETKTIDYTRLPTKNSV